LCSVGGNIKRHRLIGKQYGSSSKKLDIELPYDPSVPCLSRYPEKWKMSPTKACS
jgi:hypothetical protein